MTTLAVSPQLSPLHTLFRACSTARHQLLAEAVQTHSIVRSSPRSEVNYTRDRSSSSGGVSRANVVIWIEWARPSFLGSSRCREGARAVRITFRRSCGVLRSCVSVRCTLALSICLCSEPISDICANHLDCSTCVPYHDCGFIQTTN